MSALLHEDLDQVDRQFARHFPLARWDEQLGLKVGPVRVGVRMPAGSREVLIPRYGGFLTDEPADFRCEADRSTGLDMSAYPNILTRSRPGGRVHYVFRWDFIARIDVADASAWILLAPVSTPLCVDSVIRIATSFMAVARGGVLVHSAAVATDIGAFLFCGISGCGKSTVGKLSRDRYPLLTDEMTLVEKADVGYRVWGTPFWGELQLSVNRSAPLRAALLLAKAPYNAVEDVPAGEAIMEFMKTILYFGQSVETCDALMNVSMDLRKNVPIKRLQFRPEATFWEAIDHAFRR